MMSRCTSLTPPPKVSVVALAIGVLEQAAEERAGLAVP